MSQINPFTNSILQAPQVQRQQASDKDRQVRKAQDQQKNAALYDDRLEHQVESTEELTTIHDEDTPDPRKRRKREQQSGQQKDSGADDEPRLDVTA
jgi:hypothetical protein